MTKRTFLTGLIPLKILSAANIREHWAIKSRRDKLQKETAALYINKFLSMITLPCTIKFTRVSSRKLDSDNLQYAFKAIRDKVCSMLIPGLAPGRADDDDRITITYDQVKDEPKVTGFKITIECENEREHA